MSIKVLVANPPWHSPGKWGLRAGGRWSYMAPYPCMTNPPFFMLFALTYARRHFRKDEVEFFFHDSIPSRESYEAFYEYMFEFNPDVLIIEPATASFYHDMEVCRELHKRLPKMKIILTGAHVSALASEIMNEYGDKSPYDIWAIFKGEYEHTLVNFLRKELVVGEKSMGVWEYDLMPPEEVLNSPFAWRGIPSGDIARYCDYPIEPQRTYTLWGSRGCPYRCIFCQWPAVMYNTKYRPRSPANILADIDDAFRLWPQLNSVYFDDDTFNIGEGRLYEISEGLMKRNIRWGAMCRPDTCSIDTWRFMVKCGLTKVKLGIESGSPEMIKCCKKRLDLGVARETIRVLKSCGVKVHLTFTEGLPGEKAEDLTLSHQFLEETRPDTWQWSYCVPFPGTPFWKQYREQLKGIDFALYDGTRFKIADMVKL